MERVESREARSVPHAEHSLDVEMNIVEKIKEYSREKPIKALIFSACAGFLVGYIYARLPGNPTTDAPPPRHSFRSRRV